MNQAPSSTQALSGSAQIDQKIDQLGGWRADALRQVRQLIKEALPDVIEESKWGDTPVWSHNGILCTGESYKAKVKLTFAKGAALPDPTHLFNSSLDGNVRRAIDIAEGQALDAQAFKALILAAAEHNSLSKAKTKRK